VRLNNRHLRVLKALQERPLRWCDLPIYVGRTTMFELVDAGLVEIVDPSVGAYATNHAWRLVPPIG